MQGVVTTSLESRTAAPARGSAAASACLVCGATLQGSKLAGLRRCTGCSFTTADTALGEADFVALYGRDYFHGCEYHDYVAERESLRLNFVRRLATLEALAGGLRGKSLLEIGCAYGFFLELAKERGLRAHGVDITEDGVRFAREELRVDARAGDYLALPGEPVDIVAMWDTIEHLRFPDRFVAKAASELRPGGLLALTTGDLGSINARLRGRRWRMIHPPTHLHYFDVATVSLLLQRNGLDVVHVSHPGISRRLHAILYMVLAQRLKRPTLYAIARRLTPNLSIGINLRDIMFVVARKRASASG